jgi:ribosomal protein L11 methyltransferase
VSWKASLPCTRAEAEAIDAGEIELDAVLATSEAADGWRLDAYSEAEPDAALLGALAALAPSAGGTAPAVERLGDEDWVTLSQAGLAPLHVGRFHVFTPATLPADLRRAPGEHIFVIDAGRAFGTGHHETTSGCLAMLDALAERRFARVIEIGTGTGLLAFAARRLWPEAAVTATDIDPVAIEVTRENAALNDVKGVALLVADGALAEPISAAAPYDLIVANILAGPLVSMAPELAAIAAPSATLILAGLLEEQRAVVEAAYARCGCALDAVDRRGEWSVLRLAAGPARFTPASPPDPNGRDGWALDL